VTGHESIPSLRGAYTPSDISDDSSWDSELDGPDSSDSDSDADSDAATRVYRFRLSEDINEDEEQDEFERDPWNAVAVVGLRVYSKDTDVSIEVVKPMERARGKEREKVLDVDDSAADATRPWDRVRAYVTQRGYIEAEAAQAAEVAEQAELVKVGSAPANEEESTSG
jgi:hypothetical protein